jgi:hypothetical protein
MQKSVRKKRNWAGLGSKKKKLLVKCSKLNTFIPS